MIVIKLDATKSTNDYLKALAKEKPLENFTTVIAKNQTKGKGQMGATWVSEDGKNLTMSVLVKDVLSSHDAIFSLNVAVAVAIIKVLQELKIPKVSIKWPNDIMADSKKVGGILIESTMKSDGSTISIIGIGINCNQTNFVNLPKATSLVLESQQEIVPEILMEKIVKMLQKQIAIIPTQAVFLWQQYHELLFKKGVPMVFETTNGNRFMGIVERVTQEGKLELLLEDDSKVSFGIKEIQMLSY
jgi:BirA family transcriptional regulator, biotin operon repressor / biotin---[acetyl-CoA-carboxylase] ligase